MSEETLRGSTHGEVNHERAEGWVRVIRRKTRKLYSAEEKIRIVLEGLQFLGQEWDKFGTATLNFSQSSTYYPNPSAALNH